ncbi:MAG: nucleotidyl transferase AbiEii/AbiGii toxin family protein [Patescibacteria group bacterium]|nr:nucleotidyl transferase AbiEii/AbiGii toxin family protein [Patescibacteria group bacterium]
MEQKILTPTAEAIFLAAKRYKGITDRYYFTGGTALSYYYLHHRCSEDLDFFTPQEIFEHQVTQWVKNTAKEVNAIQIEFQTLQGQFVYYFHFPDSLVKVDFSYYPFDHVGEFLFDGDLRVSSILDIGVNKLHAVTTRKRARDFFDLYEIISRKYCSLDDLFSHYRIKFDVYVSKQEWGKHFVGVLDAFDQPRFLGERDWKDVEEFFIEEGKKLSSSNITI